MTTKVINIKEAVVKQYFQSDFQLSALELHGHLMAAWNLVTTPFRWVMSQIDSTPTFKE